uniref:Uncharacterized protein n=1 Tax=Globodera rostochiensis TaxID=31243 RepID=A0A914IBF5_GLORO
MDYYSDFCATIPTPTLQQRLKLRAIQTAPIPFTPLNNTRPQLALFLPIPLNFVHQPVVTTIGAARPGKTVLQRMRSRSSVQLPQQPCEMLRKSGHVLKKPFTPTELQATQGRLSVQAQVAFKTKRNKRSTLQAPTETESTPPHYEITERKTLPKKLKIVNSSTKQIPKKVLNFEPAAKGPLQGAIDSDKKTEKTKNKTVNFSVGYPRTSKLEANSGWTARVHLAQFQ